MCEYDDSKNDVFLDDEDWPACEACGSTSGFKSLGIWARQWIATCRACGMEHKFPLPPEDPEVFEDEPLQRYEPLPHPSEPWWTQ